LPSQLNQNKDELHPIGTLGRKKSNPPPFPWNWMFSSECFFFFLNFIETYF
jgi:hypothetical protein